jgi:hypothetical protein
MKVERWTIVEVFGTGFLLGGVWSQWGVAWASMLFGVMLLAVAVIAARQGGG